MRALELGTKTHAQLTATGALQRVRGEVEELLQQLEPCQRGSILKLVDFFARLDRKQAGLRERGAARNELEHTLARWWFDTSYSRFDADRVEQQEAGAGFVSLLLNLDPSSDSAPEIRRALGELKEQREQHGRDASRALIGGATKPADGYGEEEAAKQKAANKKSTTLTGVLYTCTKRCPMTAGIELTSRNVGMLRVGETIAVMEEKWLNVEGALPGPSYNSVSGEIEQSTSPKSSGVDRGKVHRLRFQRGSQECWASVHSIHGVPLLQPRAHGKAIAFGEERYAYGTGKGRPDSLGRTIGSPSARGSERRHHKIRTGGLDTTVTSERAMLGLEWARTKQGKKDQMTFLWSDPKAKDET